jgi:hypothetical protein
MVAPHPEMQMRPKTGKDPRRAYLTSETPPELARLLLKGLQEIIDAKPARKKIRSKKPGKR